MLKKKIFANPEKGGSFVGVRGERERAFQWEGEEPGRKVSCEEFVKDGEFSHRWRSVLQGSREERATSKKKGE